MVLSAHMEYKIWIASYYESPPPYLDDEIGIPVENIECHSGNWLTEEPVWRHIGTVDSIEAARYMVENDEKTYRDSDGNCYFLEDVPAADELGYVFIKIEYGDTIEYYDCYVPGRKTPFGRRRIQ